MCVVKLNRIDDVMWHDIACDYDKAKTLQIDHFHGIDERCWARRTLDILQPQPRCERVATVTVADGCSRSGGGGGD